MKQVSRRKGSVLLMGALCAVLGLVLPAPGWAQISRNGNIETLGTNGELGIPAVKGNDVVYDPDHDGYLVVNAFTAVDAFFTNSQGAKVNRVRIKAGTTSEFPRAAYSPDVNGGAGGFLVVWPEEANGLRTRVVAYPGTLVGSENEISGGSQPSTWAAAAVAYSPTSKVFLVAWQAFPEYRVRAVVVGLDGARIGSTMVLSSGFARDPGVSWNSATNQFGVSYSAENTTTGTGFSCFSTVPAANPTGFATRECFNQVAGLTFVTDSAYNANTGRYLMTWYEIVGHGRAMKQEFDAQGALVGNIELVATNFGSYDALSMAYNPISGTYAVVALNPTSANDDLVAAELDPNGVRQGGIVTIGPGAGVRYPRVTANTEAAEWNSSFSGFGYTRLADQVFLTATRSGPTGPVSDIRMAIDSPINGAVIGPSGVLTVSGYAADRGATTGSGIDAVQVMATPTAGGPSIHVGTVNSFSPRSDLAGTLGAQFVNSGFTVSTSGLPVGTYNIQVTPHSTVTGNWGSGKSVSVTVVSGLPLMSLDTPTNGETIFGAVTASGWAIDMYASSGTGIDAVFVWAFPATGDPILLGSSAATLGINRPDIGTFFHNSAFNASGFSVSGVLPAGTYTLVAYARDAATNSYIWSAKTINVMPGMLFLDAPVGGNVSLGSPVAGWATPGTDFVHVWAFPSGGGEAVFVGSAMVNGARPDVAAYFGSQYYATTGYTLPLQAQINNFVSGQSYTLVVYGHNMFTGQFDLSRAVGITVVN